ncbi:MAG: (4Fe-4S)-binding protein [Asgard group archaeon]|nr:(4Fe-4S)-binding protein [Asgard group archaeon]
MPKQITVISGKGGTGKTTFTAGLAYLTQGKAVIADADVDAPDLHLILQPEVLTKDKLMISKKAVRDEDKCSKCGLCETSCRYQAITIETIYYFKCEGCGLCTDICPEKALELRQVFSANLFQSKTRFGPFIHVNMAIGEGTSGRIVSEVRKRAQSVSEKQILDYIIVDGSPGIGCPVIASITGVDLAVIVVEPTLSGLHDLERVIGITEHFKVKPVVCISKYDLNPENTNEIITYCNELNIDVVGKISFDEIVPYSIAKGKSIFEIEKNKIADEIKAIWENIQICLQ